MKRIIGSFIVLTCIVTTAKSQRQLAEMDFSNYASTTNVLIAKISESEFVVVEKVKGFFEVEYKITKYSKNFTQKWNTNFTSKLFKEDIEQLIYNGKLLYLLINKQETADTKEKLYAHIYDINDGKFIKEIPLLNIEDEWRVELSENKKYLVCYTMKGRTHTVSSVNTTRLTTFFYPHSLTFYVYDDVFNLVQEKKDIDVKEDRERVYDDLTIGNSGNIYVNFFQNGETTEVYTYQEEGGSIKSIIPIRNKIILKKKRGEVDDVCIKEQSKNSFLVAVLVEDKNDMLGALEVSSVDLNENKQIFHTDFIVTEDFIKEVNIKRKTEDGPKDYPLDSYYSNQIFITETGEIAVAIERKTLKLMSEAIVFHYDKDGNYLKNYILSKNQIRNKFTLSYAYNFTGENLDIVTHEKIDGENNLYLRSINFDEKKLSNKIRLLNTEKEQAFVKKYTTWLDNDRVIFFTYNNFNSKGDKLRLVEYHAKELTYAK